MATGYNDIEQSDKIYQAMIQQREALDKKYIEEHEARLEESLRNQRKSEKDIYDALRIYRDTEERKAAKKRQEDETRIRQAALIAQNKFEATLLVEGTRRERAQIYASRIERTKAFQKEYEERKKNEKLLQAQIDALQRAADAEADDIAKERLKDQVKAVQERYEKEREWISSNDQLHADASKKIIEDSLSRAQEIMASGDASKEEIAAEKAAIENILKDLDIDNPRRAEAEKTRSDLAMKELSAQAEDRKQAIRDRNQQKKDEMRWLLRTEEGRTQLLKNATVKMVGALSKAFDALEKPINSFYEYQAKYEARMQGSENQYNKMMSNIGFSVGLSPFIKQQKMVENLQKLIDTGTNYNLELRAYIATVSENIASTFDAFDSNLMRLIRIQQSDSTAARMGMEAALTKILNSRFSDSSYLGTAGGSGLADTVAGNLLDASAQLSHQMAAEFEFVTQKWLGALYSLGVGDQTISNIAQGLGYLGSGNIDALSGNDQLMSLLAMSASRGGASISDFLTGNLTASNTEKLLKGMVELLGDIANNTDSNKLTRAAFANVFGITNTDLRSISNLTQSDIDYLSGTNLNYSQALVESSNQLKEISSRMHISTMISNLIDNAQTNSALMIGGNAATYTLYKALNVVSSLVGDRGMEIPGITALGTGTTSGIDILSIAKAGIAGGGLLASLIGSLGNLESGGLPSLDRWAGYEKSLQRGDGLILKDYGVQSGFSSSAQYNNASNQSSDDMTRSAMQSSKESATENLSEEDKAAQDEAKEYQSVMKINLQAIKDNIDKLLSSNRSDNLSVYISNDIFGGKTLDVNLNSLSDSAEIKFKNALAALIVGNIIDEGTQNNSSSLVEIIKSALNGANVHIDNDYFDDFYQKQFTNIGGI